MPRGVHVNAGTEGGTATGNWEYDESLQEYPATEQFIIPVYFFPFHLLFPSSELRRVPCRLSAST